MGSPWSSPDPKSVCSDHRNGPPFKTEDTEDLKSHPSLPVCSDTPTLKGGSFMQLVFDPRGAVRCVYDEAIDLAALGKVNISRGSHVEPDAGGRWLADLSPVGGPVLGPFALRSEALTAERAWLEANWLPATG